MFGLRLSKILAILILLMGIIHIIATFTPLIKTGLECLSLGALDAMVYMSLGCGMFLVLSGVLLFLLLGKVTQFKFLFVPVFLICGFLLVNGVLAVVYMLNNPFAWMVFALSLGVSIVSIRLKMAVNKPIH